eukprot:263796_1
MICFFLEVEDHFFFFFSYSLPVNTNANAMNFQLSMHTNTDRCHDFRLESCKYKRKKTTSSMNTFLSIPTSTSTSIRPYRKVRKNKTLLIGLDERQYDINPITQFVSNLTVKRNRYISSCQISPSPRKLRTKTKTKRKSNENRNINTLQMENIDTFLSFNFDQITFEDPLAKPSHRSMNIKLEMNTTPKMRREMKCKRKKKHSSKPNNDNKSQHRNKYPDNYDTIMYSKSKRPFRNPSRKEWAKMLMY